MKKTLWRLAALMFMFSAMMNSCDSELNEDATTGTAKRTGNIKVNWVQLWEKGPKFAVYNVGAKNNKEEDLGGYYCWGGSIDMDSKDRYNTGLDTLVGEDDTATNLWGNNWRMPTLAELGGLTDSEKCTSTWTDNYNNTGKAGIIFTGKGAYSGNSIFLPIAGYYDCKGDECLDWWSSGAYWSSTPSTHSKYACCLFFREDVLKVDDMPRGLGGISVRAVFAE